MAVALSGEVVGKVLEVVVEQPQEGPERLVLARVRGCGDQDHVTFAVLGELSDQRVPLVAGPASPIRGRAGVGLVDDDQLGAGPDEVVAAAVRLDEVEGHDEVVVHVEQRLAHGEVALQPGCGGGQHQLGLDVELGFEFELPLLGQMGRAQHGELAGVAAFEQLPGDEGRLDGLAHPHVVCDEQAYRVEP